jgi:hypothetical protein
VEQKDQSLDDIVRVVSLRYFHKRCNAYENLLRFLTYVAKSRQNA